MARAALNWTVRDLAEAARLHRNTITNIETGKYAGHEATLAAIESALKRAGVEFIDETAAARAYDYGSNNGRRADSGLDQ